MCFQGKNQLFYCIFKTKAYGLKFSVCFEGKIDYFTVFSRSKFMDYNLVCVFNAKIDNFTVFSKQSLWTSQPKGVADVEPRNWIFGYADINS